ncbi:MAG: ATP-binding cassette domain-containing protein [Enterococcus italicus]
MIIKGLNKKIDNNQVLSNIQLTVPKGVICGIVGRNGSGKTTLFRTIMGHYQKDSGEVLIERNDIALYERYKEKIFYIDTQFHPLDYLTPVSIGDYFQLLYPSFDIPMYHDLLRTHNLPPRRFQKYSKGMQGLLLVILSCCSNCDYLILDEPLDGLDVIVRKQATDLLLDVVNDGDRSIIISSHNLAELEKLADQVSFFKDGTITQTLHLEDQKAVTKKWQFVFRQKAVPDLIKQQGTILSIQGRVVVVVFKKYTNELANQLLSLDPVLMEELPVSLEDLFIEVFSDRTIAKEEITNEK